MADIKAYWSISLDVDCPYCGNNVDLLRGPDFWDGAHFQPIEHGSRATTNVDAICPDCSGTFVVDYEY